MAVSLRFCFSAVPLWLHGRVAIHLFPHSGALLLLTLSRVAFSSGVASESLCLVPLATAGVAFHSILVASHRAACAVAGVLGRRDCVVESAEA